MAATMDHETSSTKTPSDDDSERVITSTLNTGPEDETMEDKASSSENAKDLTKSEVNLPQSGIRETPSPTSPSQTAVSSSLGANVTPSQQHDDHDEEGERDEPTKLRVHTDIEHDAEKVSTDVFKLPGLPFPGKSPEKVNKPLDHVATKPVEQRQSSGTTSATSRSTKLQKRTGIISEDASGTTKQTLDPNKGDEFAFAKPQFSDVAANKKPLQSRDSSAGHATDSKAVTSTSSSEEQPVSSAKKQREKSPAEKLSKVPPLPYKEPTWSGIPTEEYHLEVLKGGSIVSKIPLNDKAYHVFGRLETCDVALEHPSLSRYHLVLQYRSVGDSQQDPGFYLYDLGSTHGSWFNKQQMESRVFHRMRVGHMFKLGGSTRMYILQGPSHDEEAESDLSIKELKELRQQQLAELEERKRQKKDEEAEMDQTEGDSGGGISWGMDYEEADDADTTGDNPFAIMTQEEKEATYIKDPKKALRGYFEREGYDLEYNVEEKESGFNKQFVCKVELPLDDASGRPIIAEAAVSGKKKESVLACALEACRILDAHGVLRQATHESRKRKTKNWKEDDYYDSDEDTFLDRTGEIEKKRMQRMKKAGVIKEKTQTYDSLKSELADVDAEIQRIETDMSTGNQGAAASVLEDDSLDAFMESIKSGKTVDKTWRAKLKLRLIELKKDRVRLTRLVDIARPASMPALQKPPSTQTSFAALSKKLPMFGSMKGRASLKPKLKSLMPSPKATSLAAVSQKTATRKEEVEEEVEEDDQPEGELKLAGRSLPDAEPIAVPCPSPVSAAAEKLNLTESKEISPLLPTQKVGHGPSFPIKIKKQTEEERGKDTYPVESDEPPTAGQGKEARIPLEEAGPPGKAKKPRMVGAPQKRREVEEQEEKEDFADWMPPVGQTGDGKTHLNAKFGY